VWKREITWRTRLNNDEDSSLQGACDSREHASNRDGGVEVGAAVVPRSTHHSKVGEAEHQRTDQEHEVPVGYCTPLFSLKDLLYLICIYVG
jgi:hypothetical protein